jgi:hypothetical protein
MIAADTFISVSMKYLPKELMTFFIFLYKAEKHYCNCAAGDKRLYLKRLYKHCIKHFWMLRSKSMAERNFEVRSNKFHVDKSHISGHWTYKYIYNS